MNKVAIHFCSYQQLSETNDFLSIFLPYAECFESSFPCADWEGRVGYGDGPNTTR